MLNKGESLPSHFVDLKKVILEEGIQPILDNFTYVDNYKVIRTDNMPFSPAARFTIEIANKEISESPSGSYSGFYPNGYIEN